MSRPISNTSSKIIIVCPICDERIYAKYRGTRHLWRDDAKDRQSRKCQQHPHMYMYMSWYDLWEEWIEDLKPWGYKRYPDGTIHRYWRFI